jgi:hypothetical protein
MIYQKLGCCAGRHPASGSMTLYDGHIKAKNNERKKEKEKGEKKKGKKEKKRKKMKEEKRGKAEASAVSNLRPPAYNALTCKNRDEKKKGEKI